jgi:hypothetical protein
MKSEFVQQRANYRQPKCSVDSQDVNFLLQTQKLYKMTENYLIIHMFKMYGIYMQDVYSTKSELQDVHARMLDGMHLSDVHSCITA